jgi:Fe-S-cluster-containing dehydrogenase component
MKRVARYGMIIDLASCIGCRACMVACKTTHGIPVGEHEGREYYRIWPVEVEMGDYPYVIRNMTPWLCMQCQDPPCVKACSVPGAIYQRDDGIVLIDERHCTGCLACKAACPYGAIYFRPDKGTVDKCTFCFENIEAGRKPECVVTCPVDSLIFGNLNDTEDALLRLIKDRDARPLHPEVGTSPSVYYTAHAARLRGKVLIKETDFPVKGATIAVLRIMDGMLRRTSTDGDGIFFFWDLRLRSAYLLTIEVNGHTAFSREILVNNEYMDLGRIQIPKQ